MVACLGGENYGGCEVWALMRTPGAKVIVFVSALILEACGLVHRAPVVAVGRPLPAMTFATLDGSTMTLKPAPGRVTFINIFATWCPPCKAETPDLVAFARAEASKGVDVVGIDRQESPGLVEAFRAQYHLAFPTMIDTGRTTQLLGIRVIPHTFVVDRNGIVRASVSGPMTRAQMDDLAAQAEAGT